MDFGMFKNLNKLTDIMVDDLSFSPIGWVDLFVNKLSSKDMNDLIDFFKSHPIESTESPYTLDDLFSEIEDREKDMFLSVGIRKHDGSIQYALSEKHESVDFDLFEEMSIEDIKQCWAELYVAVKLCR